MTEAARDREQRLRQSYIKHAALAQLHRWWQYYDDSAAGLPNTDAHFLKASTVHVQNDGAVTISAEVERLTRGRDTDGGVMRSTTHCSAVLRPTDAVLPKITEIRIADDDLEPAAEFRPAYPQNRIRSLVHYFTALVENPGRDPQPFRELLAPGFRLHFVEPAVDSFDALTAWVAGPLSSVVASTHVVSGIGLERLGERDYAATIDMQSEALFPDGSGVASRNSQTWTVIDDKSERFARIAKIAIRRDEVRRC